MIPSEEYLVNTIIEYPLTDTSHCSSQHNLTCNETDYMKLIHYVQLHTPSDWKRCHRGCEKNALLDTDKAPIMGQHVHIRRICYPIIYPDSL